MKFYSALFALMAVSSVVAAPAGGKDGLSILRGNKAGKGGKAAASQNPPAVASAADNSTAVASSADNSTATSVDNSANSTAATGTATAAASIRTRPCDMGDQSLAGGLQASTLVGFGQQAAVTTLQNATAAADFTDGVTRLQQFSSTQALQLQMVQNIADDGSLAQPQLALLAASQTATDAMIKTLVDATTSADTLTQLLAAFAASTGDAQDGAANALVDCFLPLNAVSG